MTAEKNLGLQFQLQAIWRFLSLHGLSLVARFAPVLGITAVRQHQSYGQCERCLTAELDQSPNAL